MVLVGENFFLHDVVVENEGESSAESLRIVMPGVEGRGYPMISEGLFDKVLGRVMQEKKLDRDFEEGKINMAELWLSSSLAKFCQCLEIQTEGFGGEFLKLLKKKMKRGRANGNPGWQ